jgi:hypothetical protein
MTMYMYTVVVDTLLYGTVACGATYCLLLAGQPLRWSLDTQIHRHSLCSLQLVCSLCCATTYIVDLATRDP